jgi:hypothetical protein
MLALLQMEKKIQRLLFAVLFFASTLVYGQSKPTDPDMSIKNSFYKKFKREVLSYSHKEYDALFFDFLSKSNDSKSLLTKEEYYTYTIKIAIYSEKLGLLYKNKKDEANATKQEWFDKNYTEYLTSKK